MHNNTSRTLNESEMVKVIFKWPRKFEEICTDFNEVGGDKRK
jgi:hypothetical protein